MPAMSAECYPIATLPHTTKFYRDYLAMGERRRGAWVVRGEAAGARVDAAGCGGWRARPRSAGGCAGAESVEFGAGAKTLANIAKLRRGARAVVTGQQVGLLGGPLLTLLKAATAIARAKQVTAATGVEHVPVFWLATEDHDLEEVDQVSLLSKTAVETLRLG